VAQKNWLVRLCPSCTCEDALSCKTSWVVNRNQSRATWMIDRQCLITLSQARSPSRHDWNGAVLDRRNPRQDLGALNPTFHQPNSCDLHRTVQKIWGWLLPFFCHPIMPMILLS